MCAEFEQILAEHCAPALLGCKASSLVCGSVEQWPHLRACLRAYSPVLARCGVELLLLGSCRGRWRLLVCHKSTLEAALRSPAAVSLLRSAGYPRDFTVAQALHRLRLRMVEEREFPHEIGVFLGYPPADVQAFCRFGGANCKLCGYWKVYGDVEHARSCFARYDDCRECLCGGIGRGRTLAQLLTAA